MRKLEGWIVACAAVLGACAVSDSTGVLGTFGPIPLNLSYIGGRSTGIGGFSIGTGWAYMFDGFQMNSGTCAHEGGCGVGGVVTSFGTLSNGGDPFYVVVTQNVYNLATVGNPADVVKSGIETLDIALPPAGSYRGLRLSFDYAFAASRPATLGDSAAVRVQSAGSFKDVLSLASTDMGAGITPRPGGCGSFSAADPVIVLPPTYAQCSDWTTAEVDLTGMQGRSVRIQFVAFEGDGDRKAATDHPVALLFRNVALAGAQ